MTIQPLPTYVEPGTAHAGLWHDVPVGPPVKPRRLTIPCTILGIVRGSKVLVFHAQ